MNNYLEKLKQRWNLKSAWQVFWVLWIFACTGFTVLFIRKPILNAFGIERSSLSTLGSILYFISILPVYQVLLLFYGFIFGQFQFFWEFEKRTFGRIFGKKKKK